MTEQKYIKLASALAVAKRGQTSPNPPVTTFVTATSTGESKWITLQVACEDTHTLRHQHYSKQVGKLTILHHNPSLTTRRPRGGHHPIRIVLYSELTIPITSKILQNQLQNERRGFYVHGHH